MDKYEFNGIEYTWEKICPGEKIKDHILPVPKSYNQTRAVAVKMWADWYGIYYGKSRKEAYLQEMADREVYESW